MLATIKKWLAYLDWVALIGFIVVFGSLIWRISVVGAILAFLLAVAMIGFMFVRSSLKFSPQNRISAGKPLGEPLVDTAILLYSYVAILDEGPQWNPLFVAGLCMVIIDLALWFVGQLGNFTSDSGS